MSDSLIIRRGGGGTSVKPADALLRVSVPTGSTVVVSRAGVILSPSFYTTESIRDHVYFIIPQRMFSDTAWNITATRITGSTQESATESIVINASGEYDKSIVYDLILFDASVLQPAEMEALFRPAGSGKQGYLHDVDNYLGFKMFSGSGAGNTWACITDIDLVNIRYNVLHFTAYAAQGSSDLRVGLTTDSVATSSDVHRASFAVQANISTSHVTVDLDISNISSVSHAFILVNQNSSYPRSGYISKIWATQV